MGDSHIRIAVGDSKETKCSPNKESVDCDTCRKERVETVTDAYPVRQEACSPRSAQGWLPKEVTCGLTPKTRKEPNLVTSRRSRPGGGNEMCYGAEPGMVSLQQSPNGMERPLPAPTSWAAVITGGEAMPAECLTRCLASSQHSRNVNCSYDVQRLGSILGWGGSIKSPSWSYSGPVCLSPCDVRPWRAFVQL